MKLTKKKRNLARKIAHESREIREELEPMIAEKSKIFELDGKNQTVLPALDVGFDLELINFYNQALIKLIGQLDVNTTRPLHRYFDLLLYKTDVWCRFSNENAEDEAILKENLYYRLAYIYFNSTCISSAVAHYFSNVINKNPEILQNLLHKKKVRICSMGGGCPSDIVAMVKVLESKIDSKDDLDIHVTILDKDSKWKNTGYAVLMILERFRKATYKIDFIETDLNCFPYTSNVLDTIKNADIVSMVKMLSEVTGRENKEQLVKKLFQEVQAGSIIFVLDDPQREIIECCGHFRGVHSSSSLLYEKIYGMHALGDEAVMKQFCIYREHFGNLYCNTALRVFVRVWLKSKPGGNWSSQRRMKIGYKKRIEKECQKIHEDKLNLLNLRDEIINKKDSILSEYKLLITCTREKKLAGTLSTMESVFTPQEFVHKVHITRNSLSDLKTALSNLQSEKSSSIEKVITEGTENNKSLLCRIEELQNGFQEERLNIQSSIGELTAQRKSILSELREYLKKVSRNKKSIRDREHRLRIVSFREEKKLSGWNKKHINEALSAMGHAITKNAVSLAEAVHVIDCSLIDLKTSLKKLKCKRYNYVKKLKIEVKENDKICSEEIQEIRKRVQEDRLDLRDSIDKLITVRNSLPSELKLIISFRKEMEFLGWSEGNIRKAQLLLDRHFSPLFLKEEVCSMDYFLEGMKFSVNELKCEKIISIIKLKNKINKFYELCSRRIESVKNKYEQDRLNLLKSINYIRSKKNLLLYNQKLAMRLNAQVKGSLFTIRNRTLYIEAVAREIQDLYCSLADLKTSLNMLYRQKWVAIKKLKAEGRLNNKLCLERIGEIKEQYQEDRLTLQTSIDDLLAEKNSLLGVHKYIISCNEERKNVGWYRKRVRESLLSMENPTAPKSVAQKVHDIDYILEDLEKFLNKLEEKKSYYLKKLITPHGPNITKGLNQYLKIHEKIVSEREEKHFQGVAAHLTALKLQHVQRNNNKKTKKKKKKKVSAHLKLEWAENFSKL